MSDDERTMTADDLRALVEGVGLAVEAQVESLRSVLREYLAHGAHGEELVRDHAAKVVVGSHRATVLAKAQYDYRGCATDEMDQVRAAILVRGVDDARQSLNQALGQIQAAVRRTADRGRVETRKCVCFHAPKQHGRDLDAGCDVVGCDCRWDGQKQ